MNYLLRSSSRGKKKTLRVVVGVFLAIIIIFFVYAIFPRFFPTVFTAIGLPFWRAEDVVVRNGTGVFGYFLSKRSLFEENEALREENTRLRADLSVLELLQKENGYLKEVMGRSTKENVVLARVLRRPPATAYDTLIVDAGEREGLAVGDKVSIGESNTIGEVREVFGRSAKVVLYSTYGEKIDVELASSTITATAVGRGGGNFEAVVPRDAKIAPGELVTLPGLSPQVFGVVEDSSIDSARAFQKVLIRSTVSLAHITWVTIVKQ